MKLPAALLRLSAAAPARRGLACIGAVTLGFILLCGAALLDARRDATAASDMQAHNIAITAARDVARNLDLYDLSLRATVEAMELPTVKTLDPALQRMLLFPRASRALNFDFIEVLNAAGEVIADSNYPTPRASNYSGRDYFRAHREDPSDVLFIGAPFGVQPDQSPSIAISRRVSNPDGSLAGVVVGSLRLAYFRDLFSRLNLGPHGSIALLRRDGMVLIRLPFNPDDIGRTLPPDAPFFRAPDGGQVDDIDPTDRLRRRFLIQPVGDFPLMVQVGLADTDIYGAWRTTSLLVGLAVSVLSVIDLGLLLVLDYAVGRREQGEAALQAGNAQMAALAEQRQNALAVMAQTAAAKTRFLAAMSHELRTPLNSILGYAELLALDGTLAPVQSSRLAAMRSAGEHLRDVINQVLDFSRVEADDRPTPSARTDLAALIAQCRAIAAPMASGKGLELSTAIAPDVPSCVMADAAGLRQILLNLLGNAVKFTDHGEVALSVTRGAAGIRFTVADTGIGIPASRREHLFQPYERLDADRLGVAGTGLGLAIAARLVARMGGHIRHEDNPGGGSVFWFEVPLTAAATLAGPENIVPPAPSRPLRVLVVDDSGLNRDVAASFLRRAGHTVAEAEDGEAAVCHVAAEDFDVVLMGLRMPQLDGAGATRRIRALPGRRGRTPVIALTAQVSEDGGAALREAGFQGYLLKPIDRQSLLASVATAADATVWPPAPPPPALSLPPDIAAPSDDELNPDGMQEHLGTFAAELGDFIALLDAPPSGSALSDLAHRIAGDAGQLGYMALWEAARQFETAAIRQDPALAALAATLRNTVADTLDAVDQRKDFMRRTAITSAKLP